MFVVDTNILIYAANEDAREHEICLRYLEKWCNQVSIWHVSWRILYEFLRVVTHPRVFRQPWSTEEAWNFIEVLISSPGLKVLSETEAHHHIATDFFKKHSFVTGNFLFDAHTAILMKEHGIDKIYSRDAGFHKFSSITVIDPLK